MHLADGVTNLDAHLLPTATHPVTGPFLFVGAGQTYTAVHSISVLHGHHVRINILELQALLQNQIQVTYAVQAPGDGIVIPAGVMHFVRKRLM
ncbi:hypothetical protein Rhopal_006239-T1 [Rhodotorula paludigena]|uniref:Cupin type-1 domain-containing protein n=1 Tax=Rhodotorula paludigena TaxID=86838 RepID=A0AAV5GV15_9BASI|nr:hypothetical protein Rhopal_006239-T1 [Rhodotorula paludigena]